MTLRASAVSMGEASQEAARMRSVWAVVCLLVLLSALGVPKPNFISESIASIDDRVELNYQVILPKSKI